MADVIIEAGSADIWSADTQAKIRATTTGDTITLRGSFTLADQFQILGGATILDLREASIEVAPESGGTACILLRNTDGQPRKESLWVRGGHVTYAPKNGANTASAVVYVLDIPDVRIDDLKIDDVDACNGLLIEARNEKVRPKLSQVQVLFREGSKYEDTGHVAFRLKSNLTFHDKTDNQNDSTRAGTIAYPKLDRRIEFADLTGCKAEGGYYGFDLSGVYQTNLRNCVTSKNARGISIQDTSYIVNVEHCRVYENRSAGIHLAYGSNFVTIKHNLIWSTRASGEAMIQAYVGTKDNKVQYNAIYSSGNPSHAIQGALGGLLAVTNTTARLSSVSHAMLASEAQWDTKVNGTWHSRSRAAENNNGLNQNLENVLDLKDSTFLLENAVPLMGVTSAVIAGEPGKAFMNAKNVTLAQPGFSQFVRVQAEGGKTGGNTDGFHGPIPFEAGGHRTVAIAPRKGNDFETRAKDLLKYGFLLEGGSTPKPQPPTPQPQPQPNPGPTPQPPNPQPQPPTPPAPPPSSGITDAQTMKGLTGTNLAAVITYPEEGGTQTRQWADWIAFFEFTDGNVTKYPDQVQVPQWDGDRGFPAIILPKNGHLATANWSDLTRTYVTLNGGKGYVGSHSTIPGVQWYARGEGMKIANPAVAKDQKTGKAVVVNENPATLPDTVGSIAPSGYATYVWVSDRATKTFQFVAIRNGEAVPTPEAFVFNPSILFTDPKLFPAIVWEGEGFPNDEKLRNMSITWATVPAEYSGRVGPHNAGSKLSLANDAQSQLVTEGGQKVSIVASSVTKWFPKEPSAGGGGHPQPQPGPGTSGRDRVAKAIRGVGRGHELNGNVPIPWFTDAAGRSLRPNSPDPTHHAQASGGSTSGGGMQRYSDIKVGSQLYNHNGLFLWGGAPTSVRGSDKVLDLFNTWYVLLPCYGWSYNPNTHVHIREARVYVLPKGQTRWVLAAKNTGRAIGDWANDYLNNMSTPQSAWRIGTHTNEYADILCPTKPENITHGGSTDFPGSDYLKTGSWDGILYELDARLAPDAPDNAKVAIQVGLDRKATGVAMGPGGFYPGAFLSNLRMLSKQWQTFSCVNAVSGQDSDKGGPQVDDARLLNTTFPD